MLRDSRHSEVNVTDTSWPLWRLQSSKWQSWISNPNLNGTPMLFALPMVLKTTSMSHMKSYSPWRRIRSQFLYSTRTSTAPALPALIHLHSWRLSHVCRVRLSNSGARSLKTAIETHLPCACKAPNGTPNHSPLYLKKGLSRGPHHCWSPFKRYAKERKLLMASGCSNLSWPPPITCISYVLLCNKQPHNIVASNSKHLLSHSFRGSGTPEEFSSVVLAQGLS